MKSLCLISLSIFLLTILTGCSKEKKGILDGGYYFFDLNTSEIPELSLWIDDAKIRSIEYLSYSTALNGFIEKESKELILRGTSDSSATVKIRFGSVEEKKDIVVIEQSLEAGKIDASWSLDDIRSLAQKKLKG